MDIVQRAGERPALYAVDTVAIAATVILTAMGRPLPIPFRVAAEAVAEVVVGEAEA